jgi:hypothetical protein
MFKISDIRKKILLKIVLSIAFIPLRSTNTAGFKKPVLPPPPKLCRPCQNDQNVKLFAVKRHFKNSKKNIRSVVYPAYKSDLLCFLLQSLLTNIAGMFALCFTLPGLRN